MYLPIVDTNPNGEEVKIEKAFHAHFDIFCDISFDFDIFSDISFD